MAAAFGTPSRWHSDPWRLRHRRQVDVNLRRRHLRCRRQGQHARQLVGLLLALIVDLPAGLAEGKHLGCPTWGDADDRVKAKNLALLAADHNKGVPRLSSTQ
jgi:hypothetical protein